MYMASILNKCCPPCIHYSGKSLKNIAVGNDGTGKYDGTSHIAMAYRLYRWYDGIDNSTADIQTGLFPIISSINIISVQIPEIILSRGVKVFVMDLTRKGIKTLNIAPLAATVLFIHQAELLLYAIYALFHLNI